MLSRSTEKPTRNGEAKTFQRECYHVGSAPVAGAVSIRRLIQAEDEMARMVDQRVNLANGVLLRREGWALPAYPGKLPYRTGNRLDTLLNLYRGALFDDEDPDDNSKATGQRRPPRATEEAYQFLRQRGERLVHQHHGDADDRQRSFYLLDVIPEHRFCVG